MIGREDERAMLARLAALADGGSGRALVLRGTAGIGKSTLVEWTLDQARERGHATVRIAGAEGDSTAPAGGVGQLCQPFAALLEELPATAAATLRAVLDGDGDGAGAGEPPPRLALGVALTALLGLASEASPLLVAVDDAQWLDPESLEALLFAARRLGDEPVALLVAVRDGEPAELRAGGLPLLELGPLGERDAAALVRRGAGTVAEPVVSAVVAAGGGNPLALVELTGSLTADQLAGRAPLPDPLGGDGDAAAPFHARIAALPEPTRRALAVVAAEASGRADAIAAAASELGLDADALRPAEAAGLVERRGAMLAFVHPLCRAAAYRRAGEPERAAAHRALAAAHAVGGDPVVRAEHLARATDDPDEAVAAELERAAKLARRRAAPSLAARLALRAAELSPAPRDRVRRTLAAAWLLPDTAHGALALPAIEAVLPLADGGERVELVRALANANRRLGRFEQARELVLAEADSVAAAAPAAAARLLLTAVPRHVVAATYDAQLGDAERALALAAAAEDRELARDAELIVAHAAAMLGDNGRARALLDRHAGELGELPLEPVSELAVYPADAALSADRLELAELALRKPVRVARRAGDVAALIYPLTVRARLRLRRGELRAAEADAREAVRLATDSVQTGLLALALGVLALVEAATGPAGDGRAHAEEAIARSERLGRALALYPHAALGRLELAAGRPEAAVEPLRWCARFARDSGLANPELAQDGPDLVEALAAGGERAEARAAQERFAALAAAVDSPWGRAVALRGAGIVEDDDEAAVALLRRAADALAPLAPLDAARARLALGRRLRSGGDRDGAARELRRATAELRRLGATLWADAAAAELPAGEREPAAAPLAALSPLEERIARLAADGLTNPEIGELLFYSRKTIERRLSAIFAKLGVRSRTELARRLGGG